MALLATKCTFLARQARRSIKGKKYRRNIHVMKISVYKNLLSTKMNKGL